MTHAGEKTALSDDDLLSEDELRSLLAEAEAVGIDVVLRRLGVVFGEESVEQVEPSELAQITGLPATVVHWAPRPLSEAGKRAIRRAQSPAVRVVERSVVRRPLWRPRRSSAGPDAGGLVCWNIIDLDSPEAIATVEISAPGRLGYADREVLEALTTRFVRSGSADRVVRFGLRELARDLGRGEGGRQLHDIEAALFRLTSTTIRGALRWPDTGDIEVHAWGLVDEYAIAAHGPQAQGWAALSATLADLLRAGSAVYLHTPTARALRERSELAARLWEVLEADPGPGRRGGFRFRVAELAHRCGLSDSNRRRAGRKVISACEQIVSIDERYGLDPWTAADGSHWIRAQRTNVDAARVRSAPVKHAAALRVGLGDMAAVVETTTNDGIDGPTHLRQIIDEQLLRSSAVGRAKQKGKPEGPPSENGA